MNNEIEHSDDDVQAFQEPNTKLVKEPAEGLLQEPNTREPNTKLVETEEES